LTWLDIKIKDTRNERKSKFAQGRRSQGRSWEESLSLAPSHLALDADYETLGWLLLANKGGDASSPAIG
jgi:hypothetical protein